MADVFTPEKRSEVMSRIRGRDTRPERLVRSMLHRLGYRFTVAGPKNRLLPGRPDIVLPKFRTVVFVHGCFWHGHEHCPDFRLPKSRADWWKCKIEGNRARDARTEAALLALGWHVVTIWACAVKTAPARSWLESLTKALPAIANPIASHAKIHTRREKTVARCSARNSSFGNAASVGSLIGSPAYAPKFSIRLS